MRRATRIISVLAIMAGLMGLMSATALARETRPAQGGPPTIWCTYEAVTLGVDQTCINVYGEGLYVEQVSGELEKVARSFEPIEGAEINLYGTLATGARYNVTRVAPDSISAATAWFTPRANFQNGSQLCVRARVGVVDYPGGTCVTIRA